MQTDGHTPGWSTATKHLTTAPRCQHSLPRARSLTTYTCTVSTFTVTCTLFTSTHLHACAGCVGLDGAALVRPQRGAVAA